MSIRVRVRHATSCTFRGQHGPFTSLSRVRTVGCRSGSASVVMPLVPNVYGSPVTIHYYVRVTGRDGHRVQKMISVTETAAPTRPPKAPPTLARPLTIASTTLPDAPVGLAYQGSLFASGGTPPYVWSIVSGALPAGLSLSPEGTISGTPTTLGQTRLEVRVADSAQAAAQSALATIAVNVVAAPPPTQQSRNWSGYIAGGGPFTAVSGTFNVPSLIPGARPSSTAEWVGLDGTSAADASLIQAGVQETYDPSTNAVRWFAWWEILPDPETRIALPVAAGDVVTVAIGQLGPGSWKISVTNDTTSQTFSTTESYSGPGASAEWIVEAPSSALTGGIAMLGSYTPNVTFRSLSTVGAQASLTAEVMVQSGVTVSEPSALTSTGFAVAYGAVAPAAPG